jgi:hypothetical protein
LSEPNGSSVRAQWIDDLQAREVSFILGDNHAIIRFSDGGKSPLQIAAVMMVFQTLSSRQWSGGMRGADSYRC